MAYFVGYFEHCLGLDTLSDDSPNLVPLTHSLPLPVLTHPTLCSPQPCPHLVDLFPSQSCTCFPSRGSVLALTLASPCCTLGHARCLTLATCPMHWVLQLWFFKNFPPADLTLEVPSAMAKCSALNQAALAPCLCALMLEGSSALTFASAFTTYDSNPKRASGR